MAYNNGFPIGYQPVYQQYQIPTPQTVATVTQPSNNLNNGIVWVQGEAGAKAYPVAAGNTVMLLDSENPVFYMKSTDASGMPQPLRIFDFTERTQTVQNSVTPQSIDASKFVTREEFEERFAAITAEKGDENNA